MDVSVGRGRSGRRWGAWVVVAVGTVLATASVEYLFVETARGRGEFVLSVVEITLLLGIAYGVAYGGYWLTQADFDGPDLWRVAAWCLVGLVGTGAIGAWVLVNQFWQGTPVPSPVLFGLTTLAVGAAGGVLVGVNEARARERAREATRQREDLYVLNELLRHHILNGTQVIVGEAVRLEDHVDAEGQQSLSAIRSRGDRLADLVETARTLTTSLSGESQLYGVDLAGVVETEVEEARRTYPEATLTVDAPPGVEVRGDDAIGAVFEQLLRNAVEYSDADEPTVEVTAERAGDDARVRVADDGPGMTDEEKAHAFERGRHGQAGLGLYVVDALVTRYGGEVSIEDNEPRGTVFVVDLPVA